MKHKVHVFNTVILVLVLAAAAAAQSTKIEQLRLDAEQGDACAKNSLGFIYANGKGVPRCFIEAHRQASGAKPAKSFTLPAVTCTSQPQQTPLATRTGKHELEAADRPAQLRRSRVHCGKWGSLLTPASLRGNSLFNSIADALDREKRDTQMARVTATEGKLPEAFDLLAGQTEQVGHSQANYGADRTSVYPRDAPLPACRLAVPVPRHD